MFFQHIVDLSKIKFEKIRKTESVEFFNANSDGGGEEDL